MDDKRWKFVKVVNGLSIIEFDGECYIEVLNYKHKNYCHKCDLIGTYNDNGCYVFVNNKSRCPAQHNEEHYGTKLCINHSYFVKGGI